MKFYGEENLRVMDHSTGLVLCVFDDKGELITEDEKLIQRLKIYFKYDEVKPKKGR